MSGLILHAEMMDNRACFVDVAGVCLWVRVGRDGVARISYAEDRRRTSPVDLDELVDPVFAGRVKS